MAQKKPRKEKVDQRLRAKVKVGLKPDGSPLYKWVSASNRKALERKQAELLQRYVTGTDTATLTLGEYIKGWLPGRLAGLAASTCNSITSRCNAHILPALGGRYIRSIKREDLLPILDACQARGLSQSQLQAVTRLIREIFAAAQADGVIQINPAHTLKAPASTADPLQRRPLTDAETAATLEIIDTHADGLLLAALYYLGLRRGEALGLQWSDIDFAAHVVRIERDIDFAAGPGAVGDVKSRTSRRVVPMPQAAEDRFRAARGIGWVFTRPDGQPYHDSDFRRVWRGLMRAMVDAAPEIEQEDGQSILTPHYYRHNFASIAYRAGVPAEQAQQWLGHSSIAITMDIYTHLDETLGARSKQAMEALFAATAWQQKR